MKYLFLFILLFSGCAYEGPGLTQYLEDPSSIVKDPHFAEYQTNLDNLEHLYLTDQVTYADYVKQKTELEDTYTQEVNERNAKLQDGMDPTKRNETLR